MFETEQLHKCLVYQYMMSENKNEVKVEQNRSSESFKHVLFHNMKTWRRQRQLCGSYSSNNDVKRNTQEISVFLTAETQLVQTRQTRVCIYKNKQYCCPFYALHNLKLAVLSRCFHSHILRGSLSGIIMLFGLWPLKPCLVWAS